MYKDSKNLKSPKELFEERRLQTLADIEYQKIKEQENIQKLKEERERNRKIISPKQFFNEVKDEFKVEEKPVEIIEQKVHEEIEENDQTENKDLLILKNKIIEIEESVSDKADFVEILRIVTSLKNKVNQNFKSSDYLLEIENIKEEISSIKDQITSKETFDSSDLYENISDLKLKIQEVRSEIPILPQPVLYDDQLNELRTIVQVLKTNLDDIPETKYYDQELEEIINAINEVKAEIPILPEVKYYDDDIKLIESKLLEIESSIPVVPEVKYYDDQISLLENKLLEIENSIPEVKYYDGDLTDLSNKIEEVKNLIPEVKYYDKDVTDLESKIEEVKDLIPNYDGDVENLKDKIKEVKDSIPEVKYYDEELNEINSKIKTLFNEVSSIELPDEKLYLKEIKEIYSSFDDKNNKLLKKIKYLEEVFDKFNEQNILQEELSEPPEVKNSDPLTPLDQNFVTFDQLKDHYRLFINRIQQQLSTIGGGGETRLEFLDDIDRSSAKTNGYVLQWNSTVGKFIGTSFSGATGSSITLNDLADVTTGGAQDGYIMVYDSSIGGFKFVDPAVYGINADANADPNIFDYGTY
jgi:uncharacterized coiled-coil DUF342 family protein